MEYFMAGYAYCEYLNINGGNLFTMIALPEKQGAFPTVFTERCKYYDRNDMEWI